MKVNAKRLLAMLAALALTVAPLAGCSSNDDGGSTSSAGGTSSAASSTASTNGGEEAPTGTPAPGGLTWPLVPEKTEFSILAHSTPCEGPGAWMDPNEIPFYKEYEEKTNVHINWETITYDAWTERMNILIAGGDMPDAFMKGKITDSDLIKNGTNEVFVNLKDLIPQYAPNFNALLQKHDGAKFITLADGIWGMPYVLESDSIRISKIFLNEEWLKAVNKEMPTTTDEFLDVLRAFRDQDANGDGDASNETPLGSTSLAGVLSSFYGAFGMQNRGSSNAYIDADPSDPSKVRFYRACDDMKPLLKYAKTLYDEKLIDQNIFSPDGSNLFWDNITTNKVGAHMYWATVVGPELVDMYQPIPEALEGPGGKVWTSVGSLFSSKGAFVITSNCKQPEVLLSWVDYFYSEEGAANYLLGTEGVSYIKEADGTLTQTELISNNPDGLSQEQALLRYSLSSGGQNPSMATDNTFKGGETYPTSLKGTENMRPYLPEEVWFAFPWTAEQSAVIAQVKPDIDTVITEFEAKFITGELDIDADWQSYQDTLKTAGVEKYIATYQEALEGLKG